MRDVAFSLMHKLHLSFDEVVKDKFLLEQCLNDHVFGPPCPASSASVTKTSCATPPVAWRVAAFLDVPLTDAAAERLAEQYSLSADRAARNS